MKRLLRTIVVVLPLTMLLAACSIVPATAPSLDGRTFLSVDVTENGVARPLVPGTRIRISFAMDGNLGAHAGCNSMGGAYRTEGGRLVVEAMFMTEMACDGDLGAQEQMLSTFLGSKPTLTLSGNELTLSNATIVMKLLDREIADPDLPLVGPVWQVHTILTGDAAASLPAQIVATITFDVDGTVSIETGCNSGGGKYSISGNTITFEPPLMTLRACAGPEGQMEAAVMAVVGAGAVKATIETSNLTLQAGGNGLMLSPATR